jgi:hypothetical protein
VGKSGSKGSKDIDAEKQEHPGDAIDTDHMAGGIQNEHFHVGIIMILI